MGMNAKSVLYFFEILKVEKLEDFSKVSVCILGDQRLRSHIRQFPEFQAPSFKALLINKGFQRSESVDVNGYDNSLPFDLSEPINDAGMLGAFDVVVNSGTTEHILNNRWQVFNNIHNLLKDRGWMIHIVPFEARGHGFWHYNEPFFQWLAKSCAYDIIDMRLTLTTYSYNANKHYLFVTLRRNSGSRFVALSLWRDPPRDDLGHRRYEAQYEEFLKTNLRRAGND